MKGGKLSKFKMLDFSTVPYFLALSSFSEKSVTCMPTSLLDVVKDVLFLLLRVTTWEFHEVKLLKVVPFYCDFPFGHFFPRALQELNQSEDLALCSWILKKPTYWGFGLSQCIVVFGCMLVPGILRQMPILWPPTKRSSECKTTLRYFPATCPLTVVTFRHAVCAFSPESVLKVLQIR